VGERWPVLTIRQPWQWAIEHGGKPVENRSWRMGYRGPLWLHAGARSRWDRDGEFSPLVRQAWNAWVRMRPDAACLLGGPVRICHLIRFSAVSALARVTGCHHASDCADSVAAFGGADLCDPWAADGQFHIELRDVRLLPEPVPCRGALGLWRLPEDVEKAARAQLEVSADA
jgi:hypothetical protein